MATASWPAAQSSLIRSEHVLFRSVLNGVLILGPGGVDPILISSPGDLIWELLSDEISLEDLIAQLASEYSAPESVVRADIEPTLRTLLEAKAIRVSS